MWLQPPFFWMGAPQPAQGLVCAVTQDSLCEAAFLCTSLTMACHSRACTVGHDSLCEAAIWRACLNVLCSSCACRHASLMWGPPTSIAADSHVISVFEILLLQSSRARTAALCKRHCSGAASCCLGLPNVMANIGYTFDQTCGQAAGVLWQTAAQGAGSCGFAPQHRQKCSPQEHWTFTARLLHAAAALLPCSAPCVSRATQLPQPGLGHLQGACLLHGPLTRRACPCADRWSLSDGKTVPKSTAGCRLMYGQCFAISDIQCMLARHIGCACKAVCCTHARCSTAAGSPLQCGASVGIAVRSQVLPPGQLPAL